jgi:hypothetical protein
VGWFADGAVSGDLPSGERASGRSRVPLPDGGARPGYPDFELEVFEERHHFDPPHRIEPERFAGLTEGILASRVYLTSVSILNIGRYIAMMITPTISPTPIIMIGSMIEVSVWIDESTSSS